MSKNTTIQTIIEDTADEFKVDPIDIVSRDGKTGMSISSARYVCAYLLEKHLPKDKIAALLGRRNHQYAYAAITRVQKRSQTDHDFFLKVLKLSERFGVVANKY